MLRKIRENELINKTVRYLIKKGGDSGNSIYKYVINKWPTAGIVPCKFDSIKFNLYNDCDDHLVNHFYYGTKYEEESDLKLFKGLAKASEIILDIGANTGLFSILSAISSPDSTIYAFEPYQTNYKRLQKNISLNSIKNIHTQEIAIADKDALITFNIPKNKKISCVSSAEQNFSKKIHPELEWEYIHVKAITLDSFAKQTINKKINLIKCDVESFEMNVFKGAHSILETDKPTIIFECFLDEERKDFFNKILNTYSYYVYLILKEGIVVLENGFAYNNGFNYLISPVKPSDSFIPYESLFKSPKKVMLI